jgi:hypothetical protein
MKQMDGLVDKQVSQKQLRILQNTENQDRRGCAKYYLVLRGRIKQESEQNFLRRDLIV